ncbi:hypothetical protein M2145_001035 [Lachnospiraceae bacterium PF1-21]|uniref:SEC-C domain-containing protein n=1 Tax=Ohessyouella blattaphilus TaxID=2949333 RepID=UPI003E273CC1
MGIAIDEIKKFKDLYPEFKIENHKGMFVLTGELHLNHSYNEVIMTDTYEIEITIPQLFPKHNPMIKELSGKVKDSYHHLYSNKQFCLASNLELRIFFSKSVDLSLFINMFVIPYLYSYKYFETYGVLPYGERSHGVLGDLEFIKDKMHLESFDGVIGVIRFVMDHPYRGHFLCPCGSGKKLRLCHGEIVREIMEADIREELKLIWKELEVRAKEMENGKNS